MGDTTDDVEVKHIYSGQHFKVPTGSNLKVVLHKPQDVIILNGNQSKEIDKNLKLVAQGGIEGLQPFYKDEKIEILPDTPLPRNQKFNIIVPKSAGDQIIGFLPDGFDSNGIVQIPLRPFIGASRNDPLKIFMFNFDPKIPGAITSLPADGDTSYLNGINFKPVTDGNSELIFTQALTADINIADGAVSIDDLSDEDCSHVVKEILGDDFEEHLDKEKVEKGEGKPFWAKEYSVGGAVEISETIERHILQDFGFKGKFYIKTAGGQRYVIFKGYAGLRKWYRAPRFSMANPKVVNLSASGMVKHGMKGHCVTLVIVGAIDIVTWMMEPANERELSDLCVEIGMDALKVIVGGLITAGVTALITGLLGALAISAPVAVVVVGIIVIGVLVGMGLDLLDQKLGVTDYMKEKGREGSAVLKEKWDEHVANPIGRMLYQLEMAIYELYGVPHF